VKYTDRDLYNFSEFLKRSVGLDEKKLEFEELLQEWKKQQKEVAEYTLAR
jgi:RIO-like serine/threonine protein kinase